jgi:hypothetical protein
MRNEKELWRYRGGRSSEVLQALDKYTYREDSLTADFFHFMTQTPNHMFFTSPTTETLPGPECLPNKGPIYHIFTL